jgi:phosphatidylglycerophosphate synthase
MPPIEPNRRPLSSRNTKWAAAMARSLTRCGLRPNQISVLSAVFAGAAGICFYFTAETPRNLQIGLLLAAAVCIQLRLLCNLFDGMVAIEGGFRTKVGEIYNEFPDRFADAFILIGAGYTSNWLPHELGWGAALLAVITAYTRALGVVAGASQQFCGPMAKPQRMAVMTVASLLCMVEIFLHLRLRVIPLALVLIIGGCLVTLARRIRRIGRELNSK